jgi:V/A-type H+-transporting ATPase subunit A
MGEKDITDETYIQFQKSELLDAVFLQQNSFHEVDGVTNPKRLREMFDMVWTIIESPVDLNDKEQIRSHFNFLRQAFIDWNTMHVDEEGFKKQKNQILNLIKQGIHAQENV